MFMGNVGKYTSPMDAMGHLYLWPTLGMDSNDMAKFPSFMLFQVKHFPRTVIFIATKPESYNFF